MRLYCEKCPVSTHCEGYKKAQVENNNSYHPQDVVRAYYWDCPLAALIEPKKEVEAKD